MSSSLGSPTSSAIRIQRLLRAVNAWSVDGLTRLNRRILRGASEPEELIHVLNSAVLAELPEVELLPRQAARQLVVHLGLYGASVGRHMQQRHPTFKALPHAALDQLRVGPSGVNFRLYFGALADRAEAGHPHRDSYASLVRWNTPSVSVYWQGERVATMPGEFPAGATRTYTGHPGEHAFLELLKRAETVELAANSLLEPLSSAAIDPVSPEALHAVTLAATLLGAVHRLNLDFMSPTQVALTPEHFLDVLRQFAVHWTPGDIPPSGAQDVEYLKRDLILGTTFPDYHEHVRRQFRALLATEQEELEALMKRPCLPAQLLHRLELHDTGALQRPVADLRRLLYDHPELAAHYFLLEQNSAVSASHLALAKKLLFKPQCARIRAGIPDGPVVSNSAGTTGMVEQLLIRLARARKNHPLAPLRALSRTEIAEIGGIPRPPNIRTHDLPNIICETPALAG
ncbi:MAG: hypothetical protein J2P17_11930 [Mycobacterium sp.]|nr:hypothetical protein [Mycobacterium sp.]